MSAINALLTRLNALEAKVTAQAETIELMSLMTPLEALNEGLKGAEPKAKKEFITLMQAMIAEFAEAPAEVSAKPAGLTIKAPKEVKEIKEKKPRAATNPTGPAAYNAKLQQVWREMVEETGQEVEEGEGKLVEAAKKAGISYRDAQRETAIRQIMEQEAKTREEANELFTGRKADEAARKAAKAAGLPTPKATATPKASKIPKAKAPKAAKAEAKAASSGPQTPAGTPPASPKVASASSSASAAALPALTIKIPVVELAAAKAASPTPQPEDEEDEEKATFLAGIAELGIEEKTIKGKVYYFDSSSNEVFAKIEGVYDLGEPVGVLDAKTGKIVKA